MVGSQHSSRQQHQMDPLGISRSSNSNSDSSSSRVLCWKQAAPAAAAAAVLLWWSAPRRRCWRLSAWLLCSTCHHASS